MSGIARHWVYDRKRLFMVPPSWSSYFIREDRRRDRRRTSFLKEWREKCASKREQHVNGPEVRKSLHVHRLEKEGHGCWCSVNRGKGCVDWGWRGSHRPGHTRPLKVWKCRDITQSTVGRRVINTASLRFFWRSLWQLCEEWIRGASVEAGGLLGSFAVGRGEMMVVGWLPARSERFWKVY